MKKHCTEQQIAFSLKQTETGTLDNLRRLVRLNTNDREKNPCAIYKKNLTFNGEDSLLSTLLLCCIEAFSEFKCALIKERQRQGIALAKKRGADQAP